MYQGLTSFFFWAGIPASRQFPSKQSELTTELAATET